MSAAVKTPEDELWDLLHEARERATDEDVQDLISAAMQVTLGDFTKHELTRLLSCVARLTRAVMLDGNISFQLFDVMAAMQRAAGPRGPF